MKYLLSFLLLSLLVLNACQLSPKNSCGPEVRAAFDVGSGSTKMKVAEFNTCTQSLTKVILEDQVRVNYQDALQASSDQNFPADVQTAGLAALKTLKEKALQQKASRFSGVATAAFRKAGNAPAYIAQVKKDLGLQLFIITQEQEALLGFKGAAALSQVPTGKLILWDIGGGSQQIVTLDNKQAPVIYYGELASVSFKNYIISDIQKRDIQKVKSPNPLGRHTALQAVSHAETHAKKSVPAGIQSKLQIPGTTVIGIGGVLSRSLSDQVAHQSTISSADILMALNKRQGLNDKEIGGDFPQTEISNLALVYAFMKALKIESYRPVKASLIDGLWFEKTYWH